MVATTPQTLEQRQVLWACQVFWLTEPVPVGERTVCFSWVEPKYMERFGKTFHQSVLGKLADLGYLERDDDSRGGHRRYYRLKDPQLARQHTTDLDLA